MRRMYSEQELTKIIKEVSEAYIEELIENGEFDDDIASYVDAYLVEHPVDVTALEGKTIAPAVVNATSSITAPSILETMSGYTLTKLPLPQEYTMVYNYFGVVKTGNKLTIAWDINLTLSSQYNNYRDLFRLDIPSAVGSKLYPETGGERLDVQAVLCLEAGVQATSSVQIPAWCQKESNTRIDFYIRSDNLVVGTNYHIRYEATFLLSENLVA